MRRFIVPAATLLLIVTAKLYELLGRVYADHHIPLDVYYGKNIPPARRGQ